MSPADPLAPALTVLTWFKGGDGSKRVESVFGVADKLGWKVHFIGMQDPVQWNAATVPVIETNQHRPTTKRALIAGLNRFDSHQGREGGITWKGESVGAL